MFGEYIVGIVLLLSFFYYLKRPKKCLKNVPGPKPNIIFGNLLDAIAPRHKQLSILTEYIRKHGKIIKLQFGPFKEAVFTSDPKLIEFVLSSTKLIGKSTQYEITEKWLGNSVFTTSVSNWKKQRRMLTPSFHLSVLSKYIDVFDRTGKILVRKLEDTVGSDSVDIYPHMNLCTLDIICEAAMGTSVNAQANGESEFVASLSAISDLMVARTLIPLPDWLYCFTPLYFRERRMLKVYHSYTEDVIDRRIENLKNMNDEEDTFSEKKRLDFLDMLLKIDVDGKPLNRTEIRDQVDTFMFGGQDTTASALTFILYCLAQHQDVQKKAYEEQELLFGDNAAPEVTIRDLQNMKYLETVIKESLRIYSPVSFIGRRVDEDLEWNGMTFPKNTDILLFIQNIHKNLEIFPEPEKFKPERFENDVGKYQYSFIPFSAGPRNCIGKMFAMLELKSIISNILRHLEIHPSKPDSELKLVPKIVLTPIDGCHVSFKRR